MVVECLPDAKRGPASISTGRIERSSDAKCGLGVYRSHSVKSSNSKDGVAGSHVPSSQVKRSGSLDITHSSNTGNSEGDSKLRTSTDASLSASEPSRQRLTPSPIPVPGGALEDDVCCYATESERSSQSGTVQSVSSKNATEDDGLGLTDISEHEASAALDALTVDIPLSSKPTRMKVGTNENVRAECHGDLRSDPEQAADSTGVAEQLECGLEVCDYDAAVEEAKTVEETALPRDLDGTVEEAEGVTTAPSTASTAVRAIVVGDDVVQKEDEAACSAEEELEAPTINQVEVEDHGDPARFSKAAVGDCALPHAPAVILVSGVENLANTHPLQNCTDETLEKVRSVAPNEGEDAGASSSGNETSDSKARNKRSQESAEQTTPEDGGAARTTEAKKEQLPRTESRRAFEAADGEAPSVDAALDPVTAFAQRDQVSTELPSTPQAATAVRVAQQGGADAAASNSHSAGCRSGGRAATFDEHDARLSVPNPLLGDPLPDGEDGAGEVTACCAPSKITQAVRDDTQSAVAELGRLLSSEMEGSADHRISLLSYKGTVLVAFNRDEVPATAPRSNAGHGSAGDKLDRVAAMLNRFERVAHRLENLNRKVHGR